jgi:hypothetical protein
MNWSPIIVKLSILGQNCERSRELVRKVSRHNRYMGKLRKYSRERSKLINIDLFQSLIVNGGKIVSFDAEWSPYRPITQLGITVAENGSVKSFNITIGDFKSPRFRYGETINMDNDAAKEWLRSVFQDAELIIGHSLKNDRSQLHKWGVDMPEIPFIDTANWSRYVMRKMDRVGLDNLAKYLGISHKGAHCAGNDSFVTFSVAEKINQLVVD